MKRRTSMGEPLDSALDRTIDSKYDVIKAVSDKISEVEVVAGLDLFDTAESIENLQAELEGVQADIAAGIMKGDKGDRGDTGASGAQGPQGIDGAEGPQGIQGPQGVHGESGTDGTDGIDGVDGLTPELSIVYNESTGYLEFESVLAVTPDITKEW